jgi:hypothetical protein
MDEENKKNRWIPGWAEIPSIFASKNKKLGGEKRKK